MKPVISPRELAVAMGVSESSLKRWADEGLIQVSKTAGGHRRIAIGEAIRFIRASKSPLVRPDVLGLGDAGTFTAELLSTAPAGERLFTHLAEGRAREARDLILSLYLSGRSVAEIADGPIRSAMQRLGELWRHDRAGVFIEHRATDICLQSVRQLRLMVESSNAACSAVGGAPTGDPYALPTLLAATALASESFHAINLGPDTPFDVLLTAASRHDARLVWLSISSIHDVKEVQEGVLHLAEQLGDQVPLFIGGQAVSQLRIPPQAHVRVGNSLLELCTLAFELCRPKEGTMLDKR